MKNRAVLSVSAVPPCDSMADGKLWPPRSAQHYGGWRYIALAQERIKIQNLKYGFYCMGIAFAIPNNTFGKVKNCNLNHGKSGAICILTGLFVCTASGLSTLPYPESCHVLGMDTWLND